MFNDKKGGMAAGANIIYVHIACNQKLIRALLYVTTPSVLALLAGNGLILETRWRLNTGTKEG
jgi:hypothetical protein